MMHTKYRDTGKVEISAEQGLEIYTKFLCNSLVGQNPKAYSISAAMDVDRTSRDTRG